MTELLKIENLTVDFISEGKSLPAVKNISLSVKRGQLLAIVGESGSGKSVTALSILRLLPQPPAVYRSGSIFFNEKENTLDLLKASPSKLRSVRGARISMIFQEPMTSLNPVMRCGEQIMESLFAHKKISADAARKNTLGWLEKVKLPDPEEIFRKYPHQLSGGQKQRVMIAMAMCCEPSLLICDEPTTALDVTVQKAVLDLIKELQVQHNMGVIFITHDLGVVSHIADEVAIMYKGELVELKKSSEIFKDAPASSLHPYTNALLSCRPALHPKGEPLPTVEDFLKNDESNDRRQASDVSLPAGQTGHQNFSDQNKNIETNKEHPKRLTETELLLKVENLVVRFPSKTNVFGKTLTYFTAVDHVNLEVFKGETLGLVGESGCGKTTLGRALLKLVHADEGKIVYEGKDITTLSSREVKQFRKNVQLIFQDPYSSLNPRLTIGSALAEPIKVAHIETSVGAQRKIVEDLLVKVNLSPSTTNRYPHEFSGGQRQRIVIARALSLGPGFLVCDESVSALDVSVQAQVLNLLNELKRDLGLTMLFISHDLSVVRYMCDRIMVMEKGKIVESGPSEEVYLHPKSEYTKRLIDAVPIVKRET